MSKNVAVFVDVANLYYSARGQEVDVDYVALLKQATKGRDLIRAYAYSGLDPENENQRKFIDFLAKNNYRVVVKDIRKFGDGRVKANLDIELVVDLFRLAERMDIAVIVSGDGDFAPAIRALQDKGVRCEVISFRPNTSGDLIAVADEFIDIMKIAGIGRKKDEKGPPPTPEMPAKEVVPEFGFREAPRAVAAAALAALKGRDANGARSAETEAGENGKRRRRRRGGRGRRRAEGAPAEGAPADALAAMPQDQAAPGWQELDDLSQVEGIEDLSAEVGEREYSFVEADEETLRELGLLDADAGAPARGDGPPDGAPPALDPAAAHADPAASSAAAPDAVEPDAAAAPRRRARRGRAAEETPAAEAVAAEPAAPDTQAAADETTAGEEEKPRRRTTRASGSRSRRTAAAKPSEGGTRPGAEAAGEEGAAEPQPAASGEPQPEPAAPKAPRRRRSTARSAGKSDSGDRSRAEPGAAASGEPQPATAPAGGAGDEGIWQRFRLGRQRPRRTE